jgi:hypothetical protein
MNQQDFHTSLPPAHDPNVAWYILAAFGFVALLFLVRAWTKRRQHESETPLFDIENVPADQDAIVSRAPVGSCQSGPCGARATHTRPRFEQIREDLMDRDRRRGYKPREFVRVVPGTESEGAGALVCRYHHDRAMGLMEEWNERQRLQDVAYATQRQRAMHAFERWGVLDQMERELVEDSGARDVVGAKPRPSGVPAAIALVGGSDQGR